jgi:hypothetical protein
MWLLDRSPAPRTGHHWTHPLVRIHAAVPSKKASGGDESQSVILKRHFEEMKQQLEATYEEKHRILEDRLKRMEGVLETMQKTLLEVLHNSRA